MAVVVRRSLLAFFVVAGILALAGALELAGRPAPSPGDPSVRPEGETGPVDLRSVRPGEEREIGAQETHEYVVDLIRGETIGLLVEQHGADVALVHVDPLGRERLRMDRPLGGQGSERLTIVAETAGRHRVKVEADSAGSYRWTRVEGPRPARATDYLSADGEREFMRGRGAEKRAQGETSAANSREAEAQYLHSCELFADARDRHGEAIAVFRLASVIEKDGRSGEADALFARAADELAATNEPEWAAEALNRRGELARDCGETETAGRLYREALAQAESVAYSPARRTALLGLAYLAISRSQFGEALDHLAAAERGPQRLEPSEALSIRLSRFDLYNEVGDTETALAWAEAAAEVTEKAEDRANVVQRRGRALHELGRHEDAVRAYNDAWPELQGQEWVAHRVVLLFDRGRALLALGRPREAVLDLKAAAGLYRELGDERQAAVADSHIAWSLEVAGDLSEALALHRRTVADLQGFGDRDREGAALHGLARAELAAGDLASAHRHILESLELLERGSRSLGPSDLRAGFLSRKSERRALLIEILMRRHALAPGAGYAEEALFQAERARERNLAERLYEQRSGLGVPVAASPELTAHRKRVDEDLRRLEVAASAAPAHDVANRRTDPELLRLLEEDRLIEAELRVADPRYAALTRPQIPARAAGIAALIDGETCLLYYSLGTDRSWLWAIDQTGLHTFPLAPRAEIEKAVREVVRLFGVRPTVGDGPERGWALRRLADLVLAPAAPVLHRRRLAVVADGALHFAPFAAMPSPLPNADEPIAARHEVVFVPSLSVLSELRRIASRGPWTSRTLAVITDPVSSPDDERLPAGRPEIATGGRELGLPGDPEPTNLGRLKFARTEADALLALVPADEVLEARDFAATRDLLLSGQLAGSRFVHFTGHGFFNEVLPAQSGLVLSRFDTEGRPVAGILRVREVYRLDLPCEMVVLSACETGRGRILRGEGVLGLTRGFLAAGARRVVVTLWEVDDRASAHLVEAFYHGILKRGIDPSAALAAAQESVRSREGWADPFYWAGFTLVGDWR